MYRIGLAVLLFVSGCGAPMGFPKELGDAVQVITEMVRDQGLLDQFTSSIDGHVNDPGIEVFVDITVASGVRMIGVDGNVSLDASGIGTQLPTEVRSHLIRKLDEPNLSDEQRAAILDLLGWNVPPSLRSKVDEGGGTK